MKRKPNRKDNVWAKIKEKFGNKDYFSIDQTDTHWNKDGNKWVLENFILDEETIDILRKG